jgi:hypothetical protein
MAKFCTQCGSQADDTATACGSCGTPFAPVPGQGYAQGAPPPGYVPPQPQGYPPPPQSYPPPQGYPGTPPKKSGSAVKWILGILLFLFLCVGLVVGGLFYLAHKVKSKIEAVTGPGGFSTTVGEAVTGDTCRFLSAADVGAAIGVPIVSTKQTAAGCEYFAKGTPGEMNSKHMAAMIKQPGVNSQQTEIIKTITTGSLNSQSPTEDATTIVLAYAIDPNSARMQMKLNSKLFGHQAGSQGLTGIGDEAFDAGGAIMMVRKGERLIRITYTGCPCNTDAIKPLAKKLADQL